jgi:type II secretory pathway component GspD/PulD (secretin)
MADAASHLHALPCRRLPIWLRRSAALALTVAIGVSTVSVHVASAQEGRGRRGGTSGAFNGDISRLPPEIQARIRAGQMGGPASPQPTPQPSGEQPKPEGEKPSEGEKPPEESKTIKRPTDKPQANAEELKAAPDKDGMVQFNFRGQPWPDVLEWYAAVSKQSLDWQELPADFVNLSTQRRYSIAETRDLLNRTLLSRGFTMISLGDVLTVVKTDKIDPSLVRRVEPDDLDDQAPHDFVRTRFPLPATLDPTKAVEDLKVVLSPAAKVTPLLASKQIQVIDAVANLRDVRDLLYGEQMVADQDVRPRLFGPFKYRRADYIADQVMIVLGIDPNKRMGPMEMQMEQQRMQMAMQMQQQGKDVSKMLKGDEPKVHIAVDKRRNFLLVNAPPPEMAIIARAIEEFDIPESGGAAAADPDGGPMTFKRHSTVSIDPDEVVEALRDLGGLNPLTQMQHDNRSKTIFALATAADHATIESLIDKLDGTGRGLKVIWLSRKTRADQVAGTIKALMVGEKKKEDNSRNRYWSPWDYGSRNNDSDESAAFRIQADVENNRLLLWANDDEYREVTALLKDLGAVAAGAGGNPNKWRVMESRTPAETQELLERLKQTWSGQNQLNINVAPAEGKPASPPVKEAAPQPGPAEDKITARSSAGPFAFAVGNACGAATSFIAQEIAAADATGVAVEVDNEAPASEAPVSPPQKQSRPATLAEQAPPINITVTPDGRIIVSSDDVAALDQLEELIGELEPPQRDFEVFQLYNSRASMVSLNLEEYFEDELGKDSNSNSGFGWWFGGGGNNREEDPATLGKPRKLRFIYDTDTNTIVAQNATQAQLETIRKLVQIYDQPVSEDSVSKRRTDIVPIKYSSAQDIGTAIKEVYRDLLSSKDKEFQASGGREGEDRGRSRSERFSFFGGSSSSSAKSTPMKMSFEGALSIGVDEISNSLIISADDAIWENVKELAVSLDEKAKPDTVVQVHELRGSLKAADLQSVLNTALSRPWPGGKPPAGAATGSRSGRSEGGDRGSSRGDRGRSSDRGGDRRGRG